MFFAARTRANVRVAGQANVMWIAHWATFGKCINPKHIFESFVE